mgnify:CR=1 FL=1
MTAKEYIKTEWGEAWLRHEWQPEDVESAMIEYGKQQWNEAIDDIKNIMFSNRKDGDILTCDDIEKLKKK